MRQIEVLLHHSYSNNPHTEDLCSLSFRLCDTSLWRLRISRLIWRRCSESDVNLSFSRCPPLFLSGVCPCLIFSFTRFKLLISFYKYEMGATLPWGDPRDIDCMHQHELKICSYWLFIVLLIGTKVIAYFEWEVLWQKKKRLNMNGCVAVRLCCDVAACIMGRPPTHLLGMTRQICLSKCEIPAMI